MATQKNKKPLILVVIVALVILFFVFNSKGGDSTGGDGVKNDTDIEKMDVGGSFKFDGMKFDELGVASVTTDEYAGGDVARISGDLDGQIIGNATIMWNGEMSNFKLDLRGLPKVEDGHHYEVWMLNADNLTMASIGRFKMLGPDKGLLNLVAEDDLSIYNSVYLTLEKNDTDKLPSSKVIAKIELGGETE